MFNEPEDYSSDVQIELRVGNAVFPVAQVGRDSLVLKDRLEFNLSGYAEISIAVDDEEEIHQVFLSTVDDKCVEFA